MADEAPKDTAPAAEPSPPQQQPEVAGENVSTPQADSQPPKPKKVIEPVPPPKPLTSGWAAILKGKNEAAASEAAAEKVAVAAAATEESAAPKTARDGKQPSSKGGEDKRPKSAAAGGKDAPKGASKPAPAAQEEQKESGASSQAGAAAPTAIAAADPAGGEAPAESKPKEVVPSQPAKPAWKVPSSGVQAAAPAAAATGGWPSLGDSKEPLPKKKQRQQQATMPAPPPPPPTGSREERPPRERRERGRGGGGGRGLPLSTLSDSLSAAAGRKGGRGGGGGGAEAGAAIAAPAAPGGDKAGDGEKEAAAGEAEGAVSLPIAAPAPPPPKPSSERGGGSAGGGRGMSGRGGNGGRGGGGSGGSRSNSSTRLAEMAGSSGDKAAVQGGAAAPAAPAAPAPPSGPAPSAAASISAAAAASGAAYEQRGGGGGGGRSGGRGSDGGRGRGGRGGRSSGSGGGYHGGAAGYPAAAPPVPQGGFLYSVGAPVFYPPAAYGVSPSMVGMSGTPVSKLQEAVRTQIDYYFSVGNLVRDVFLRSKMSNEGWIPLHVIGAFNRVRMLTPDPMTIVSAMQNSSIVEVSRDSMFMRPKEGWQQWVLPAEQRDKGVHVPAAQASSEQQQPGGRDREGSWRKQGSAAVAGKEGDAPQEKEAAEEAAAEPASKEEPAAPASEAQAAPAEAPAAAVAEQPAAAAAAQPVAQPVQQEAEPAVAAPVDEPPPPPPSTGVKKIAEDEEMNEDDMFQLDEEHDVKEAEVAALRKGATVRGKGKEVLSNDDLARLIVVKPSMKSPQKPKMGEGDDMAAVINDGLELYARELQQLNISRRASQPVAAGSVGSHAGSMPVGSFNAARPPRAPGVGKKSNFYPSSLPKGGHHGRSRPFGQSPPSVSVGWLLGSSPDNSGLLGSSPGSRRASPRMGSLLGSSLPIPKFQHPSHSLLEENGFTQIKYEKFYARCIQERAERGAGQSEEMNTLFRFWCYFLREHFNQQMYDDFRKYALDDAGAEYQYGMECLFRFYSYGLERAWSEQLYRDFEELVLKDFEGGSIYGLEKLWAFHHYTGFPRDQPNLEVQETLKKLLATEFRSLNDFKTKASQYKPHNQTQHSDKVTKPPHPKSAKHSVGSAGSFGSSVGKANGGMAHHKPSGGVKAAAAAAAGAQPAVHVQTDVVVAAGNGAPAATAPEPVVAASS